MTQLMPQMDFPQLGKYRADNERLIASKATVDVVFLGDSITEIWREMRPAFFSPGWICRGIRGQTTSQMLLRMMADVVHLKPKVLHIMAGTNDIAGNTGPMTSAMIQDNFRMMSDIACASGIKLLIASIPPAASFQWRCGLETKQPIAEMNLWLRRFARKTGATWVDYHLSLSDGTGAMKPGFADDGVHPTEAGYDAMASVIEPILRQTLRRASNARPQYEGAGESTGP